MVQCQVGLRRKVTQFGGSSCGVAHLCMEAEIAFNRTEMIDRSRFSRTGRAFVRYRDDRKQVGFLSAILNL